MAWLYRPLSAALQAITIALLLGLALIVFLAVVFRMAGSSFVWYDELASVWLAWLSYYGAALAALRRAHLGFTGVLYGLPPPLRGIVFSASELCVLGFFALVGWYGWRVLEFMAGEHLISLPWLPLTLVQSVIPVGAGLFILAQLASLPGAWTKLQRGLTPEQEEIEAALADVNAAPGKARR